MLFMYSSEKDLVDNFLSKLLVDDPWDTSAYKVEFNYMRGKTDIIAVSPSNELIAIEAKLNKWRFALQQAYRNRCFADKSYILLPYDIATNALRYEYEFCRRGVGICSLINGEIVILRDAKADNPVQPWLREVALNYVEGGERF